MYQASYFIHVLSAIVTLFYLLLPFLITSGLRAEGNRNKTFGFLVTGNRIGQYVLILVFLSGGYMSSKAGVSIAWTIVATVLILAMFAMTGIMSKPLKSIRSGLLDAQALGQAAGKARKLGWINALVLVVLVVLMLNPTLF
ncbi:hypothetical protein DUZ99_07300 [Xylanibacillus composti]|uniref:DUF2269 family protein n=1 Tax=Xylanibacillus composti TaxID=1572762 RepID=A0A8J4H6W0_9BACL|nr:hypothetical protein [Xylanibacillus composti]MDT9724799.1 hypothetical protein [Xylanibacillus composti]GIQ69848.1 hypothetical protein XYCOK13_26720 [Xylanibacillus composti]